MNSCFWHLAYLVATSTGSKSQLFQRWREWEYKRDFLSRFLLHKKALKSFLHSLTICDKVTSGNKKKKIIGIP
jgi:hypothetical protein